MKYIPRALFALGLLLLPLPFQAAKNNNRLIPPPAEICENRPHALACLIIIPFPEVCNGVDDDRDGKIDEDFDVDQDGYFDSEQCEGVYEELDCVDGDVTIHPGATEQCNEDDDNCNGETDEGGVCTPAGIDPIDGDLLSIYPQSGELWTINSITGESTQVTANTLPYSTPIVGSTSLAINADATLAYVAAGDGDDSLYSIDLHTGLASLVGPFTNRASNIQGLDIAPAAAAAHGFVPGMIYGVSIDGVEGCGPNCLYTINPTTAQSTPASRGLAANQIRGLSFDPVSGELLGLDPGGRNLYRIHADGSSEYLYTLPPTHQDSQTGVNPTFSLSHSCSGELYAVDQAYGVLVHINNGTSTWVGEPFTVHDSAGSTQLQGLDAICSQ